MSTRENIRLIARTPYHDQNKSIYVKNQLSRIIGGTQIITYKRKKAPVL